MSNPFSAVFHDRATVRGTAAVVATALALGMMPLAIVLLLRSQSLAAAGVAAGCFGVGNAIGVPIQGMLIDRIGGRRVIVIGGFVCILALVAFPCVPERFLVQRYALLFVCGLTFPAVTAAFRAWLPRRFADEKARTAAYSALSVAFQTASACGPVLVGICAAAMSPAAAVIVVAALTGGGAVLYVTSRDLALRGGRVSQPARAPWVRSTFPLLVVSAAAGFPIGALAVVAPAIATAPGQDGIAGVVLACLPAGEACGALLFGAFRLPGRRRVHLICALLLVAGTYAAGAALPAGLMPLAVIIFIAGALSSPVTITISSLLDRVAAGAVAAAYASVVSAGIGGSAIGSALAGPVIHLAGTNAALLAAAAACALAAVVATTVRRDA